MKDITLLERAAQAAHVPVRRVGGVLFTEIVDALGERVSVEWNPLKDDGDAFRLLVTLGGITLFPGEDNPNARARRAVVEEAIKRL